MTTATTSSEPNSLKLIDDLDYLCARAFQISNINGLIEDPTQRFKLYAVLFKAFGDYLPGYDLENLREDLGYDLGHENWREIEAISTQITTVLESLVPSLIQATDSDQPHLSYSTISYWSPIDGRRRTIVHMPSSGEPVVQAQTVAFAYAFFALTFAGISRELYSVIQYISERAIHRRGLRVCYTEDPPDAIDYDWWHIPRRLHSPLLDQTGASTSIQLRLIDNKSLSSSDLEEKLQTTLASGQLLEANTEPLQAIELVGSIVDSFDSLEPEIKDLVERSTQFLDRFLGGAKPVTNEQALFMLVTHIIFNRACPRDYIYAYPVLVADTCCIITLGTEKQLDMMTNFAMRCVSRSIFVHPLLLDYAAYEAQARSNLLANLTHRVRNRLQDIDSIYIPQLKALADADPTQSMAMTVGGLDEQVGHISDWVDTLDTLIGSEKYEVFSVIDLLKENEQHLRSISPGFDFSIKYSCESAPAYGPRGELEFSIDEMLHNARRAVSEVPTGERKISIDISCSGVLTNTDTEAFIVSQHPIPRSVVVITISDTGPGIAVSDKQRIFYPGVRMQSGGTGRGLYLIKMFVENHFNGIVYEKGIHGAGAQFAIVIPTYDEKKEHEPYADPHH